MGYALATRLRCTVCGAEVLVAQTGSGVLKCCDTEMTDDASNPAGDKQDREGSE
jgi:Desulfoferrodoxin, N-terminal domain